MRTPPFLALVLLLGACASSSDIPKLDPDERVQQATSLLGRPLYPMDLPADVRTERLAQLAAARNDFETDPRSVDNIIWLGRRQAYLGRYDLSILTCTEGLKSNAREPRLLRHRGHRSITIRQFDKAIADLELAAEATGGSPDEIEPDGQPNAQNKPRSTLQNNIYYHLGLARYLTGDYERALAAYDACHERSTNDDMSVATLYWTYLALTRLGRTAEARRRLEPVHAGMDVIENTEYLNLLLLFKGDRDVYDVAGGDDEIASSTVNYGVANWHMLEGDRPTGRALLRRITEDPAWPAFGHIAAEADLARGM